MSTPSPSDKELTIAVRKSYSSASEKGFALDASFSASPGFTILFGASGAGKTTLLDCVAGLQAPDAGRISIGEETMFDSASRVNLPPNRRNVGYLMQSPALFPHMTVRQNVQYGLAELDESERESRCHEILQQFRISALANRRPREISGGEHQRVALARALVKRPRVLLLDEPLTALDAVVKSQILADLGAWCSAHPIPILYVTHQREEVFALGETVIALQAGKAVARGSPHDILQRAQLETVAQLAGFENIFDGEFVAAHPEQGTMSCRIAGTSLQLEVPLSRVEPSRPLRVGIRAGDVLLASVAPTGLSAQNVIHGTIRSIAQRDAMVIVSVHCGADFEVHVTPAARRALALQPGGSIWMVVKTYSCHILQ